MKPWRFAASLAAVAAIVVVYHTLLSVNSTTVALTLLIAILAISARWGLAEATVASVCALLGLNYFFLPPVGTLTIEDPQNWIALAAFMATAITASQLSERARRRAAEAEERRRDVERLYALVQGVMLGGSPRSTVRELLDRVVRIFGVHDAAYCARNADDVVRAGSGKEQPSTHDVKVASELERPSCNPEAGVALAPVRMGARPLGGLALRGAPPSPEVVRAIADLIAISIERARALEEVSHAEAERQSETLKSALLDALAHDIKTPLTSIKAAATGLLAAPRNGADLELLTIINEETDRLVQLAAEVVAMARIEAGKLHLERRAVAVDEIVSGALADLHPAWKGRPCQIEVPEYLPPVDADPEFAQQVVKQLVDNALKYSPEATPIRVSARLDGARIVIGVADRGPGIDETETGRIFDKFYRGRSHRFSVKGTGMGLSIAKGIVEAHGGGIWVESEPGQGSAFYISLPVHPEGARR
jgi:two-component system, OmpR family, sensor histidine kinase KdpD